MPSERTQILALFADGHIDMAQAERLLCLIGSRDRFLTLALAAMLLAAAVHQLPLLQIAESLHTGLHAAMQSVAVSQAFQQLQLFLNRFLGELP
jgi:hypothetical protein